MADGYQRRSQSHRGTRRARHPRSSKPVLVVLALMLGVALVLTAAVLGRPLALDPDAASSSVPFERPPLHRDADTDTASPARGSPVAARPASASHWAAVLRTLGDQRATAWRLGRPQLLTRVYLPSSAPLDRDRRMLSGYLDRGLRVVGARLAIESVQLLAHSDTCVRLLVVDRLGPAVAFDATGHRHRLPRDLPTRHRIELRRFDDAWRIASVVAL